MSKNVIDQALALVQGQITKRLNSVISKLPEAAKVLKELSVAGARLAKSWDGMKEVPNEFQMGIQEVLAVLDPFRPGAQPQSQGHALSGNNAAVQDGTVHQEYHIDTVIGAVSKQAQTLKSSDEALKFFDQHFASSVNEKNEARALGILRTVRDALQKVYTGSTSDGGGAPAAEIHTYVNPPLSIDTTPGRDLSTPAAPEPNAALRTETQDSAIAEVAANNGPVTTILREATVSHTPNPAPTGSVQALQTQNSGPTANSVAENTVSTMKNDEVAWPRDMAKKGFHGGRNPALAGAVAAVEKSEEPAFDGWSMDMGQKRRSR